MANEEAAKNKVRADPHQVMAWVDRALGRRPFQFALLGTLFFFIALLIGPRLWDKEGIAAKLKVGARAEGNIKASHSFDYYPSDEKLEKEKVAASASILPVFDHQTDLGVLVMARITRAFSSMVSEEAEVEDPKAKGVKLTPEQIEEKLNKFNNVLQLDVSSASFALIAKANFSSEIRTSVLTLVGMAMSQLIVAHRGVLLPFENTAITVRHLVSGKPGSGGEEKILSTSKFKDLQQIREEIRLQAPVHAAKLSPELSSIAVELAQSLATPNLAPNQEETQKRRDEARDRIQSRSVSWVKGQVIIPDGDPISKEHLSIIRAMESSQKGGDVVEVLLGLGLSVFLLLAVVFRFALAQFKRFLDRPRDLLAMSVLLVGMLALTKLPGAAGGVGLGQARDLPIILYAIPVAGGAMLVRLLISSEAAALFSMVLGILCGIVADQSLLMMIFFSVTGMVGAGGVAQVQSRSTILRAGLWAGLVGACIVLGSRMFREQLFSIDTMYGLLAALAGGLLASFVTLALLPAMEWLFAYTTDVTLLELANLNHPLLRELILRAPGTYHHSMVVGSLSEAACEAIRANGLLARVACYHHDIGKMKNADYFAENFKPGDNPHNRLKPSMSALIIRSHVKDTIEMLREHGVPELVIETATQHHGKTLIEFFFHKAKEATDVDEEIHEEDYRYPGPKPQSREAGVIMLADGVEAAARSLAEPTEDRLTGVVQRVINTKFTDGQLDHCDLTLRDLHLIAKSFLQVLRGIYHQRPTYPWQQARRPGAEETKKEKDNTRQIKTPEHDNDGESEITKGGKAAARQAKSDRKPNRPDVTRSEKRGRTTASHPVQSREPAKVEKPAASPAGREHTKMERTGSHAVQSRETHKSEKTDKREHPEKSEKTENLENPTALAELAPQSPGEGERPDAPKPASTEEMPPESNPDIKRLGLN
jgi:cyclic-di-AMP phosphodiesterase PgpH